MARVVDIHSHILLPDAFAGIPEKYRKDAPRLTEAPGGQAYVEIGNERRGPVPKAFWSLPERLDEMEQEGVDMEVLSVYPYTLFYWLSADSATEFARKQNDAVAGVVKDYRRNFRGMATVPLQDVSAALDEMERAIRELGLVGVEVGTNVNGRNLDDPVLDPFFAKAEKLGALVFVHPIRAAGLERMRSYYLPVLVGNPSETSLAAASMMFGGVLERHPRLKVCFAHGGGFIPYQIGRLDRGYEVRSESRVAAKAPPSSFLDRLYFDTIVYDESALSFLVSSIGACNILLGSDSPLDMHDHQIVKKVSGLSSCSKKEKEMILGDNIKRLVRI